MLGGISKIIPSFPVKTDKKNAPPKDGSLPESVEIPVVEAPFKIGAENDLVNSLAPSAVEINKDYMVIGDSYLRMFYVSRWPHQVSRTLWEDLLNINAPIVITMYNRAIPPDVAATLIKRETTALRTSEYMNMRNKRDPNVADSYRLMMLSDERTRVEIGGQTLFFLTTTVGVYAPSLEDLAKLTTKIELMLKQAGILFYTARFEQLQAFQSIQPIGFNGMGTHQHNVNADTLSRLFPFVSEESVSEKGLFYGIDVRNNAAVFVNPFGRDMVNPNTIIIGKPGAGKSLFMKDLIEQAVLSGWRVWVLDIEKEYDRLCKDLGGTYLDMGFVSEHKINVLDLVRRPPLSYEETDAGTKHEGSYGGDEEDEKADIVSESLERFKTWMEAVLGTRLDPFQDEALTEAYTMAFRTKGIIFSDPSTFRLEPPILSDLYEALGAIDKKSRLSKSAVSQAAQYLQSALRPFITIPYSETFNCQTNIEISKSPLVVFGLSDVTRLLKPRLVQIRSFIWSMISDPNLLHVPKMEVIDEGWRYLDHHDAAQAMAEQSRRYRKKKAQLILATQNVTEFAQNAYAEAILAIAGTHLYFAMNSETAEIIGRLGKLTAQQRMAIANLQPGHFLMRIGPNSRVCYKLYPEERHVVYTTRPDEVAGLQDRQPTP